MIASRTSTPSPGASENRYLPLLLGAIAALLLFVWADDLEGKVSAVQQQIAMTAKLVRHSPAQSLADAKRAMIAAKANREAIEARLSADESPQLARARIGQSLRLKCAATGAVACAVRLAEDSLGQAGSVPSAAGGATTPPTAGSTSRPTAAAGGLESLGISKSRAIVSGSFQRNELTDLTLALASDREALWRINGISIKGNSFELDVERHIWQPADKSSKP